MSLEQLLLLAVIQGLTEFLPISSSAHLSLLHLLSNLPDQGILIDAAVHFGSLFAVLIYFRKDVAGLFTGFAGTLAGKDDSRGRLAIYLVLATVPLAIVGGIMTLTGWVLLFRSAQVIAAANIIFAAVLLICDRLGATGKVLADTTLSGAMLLGVAQVFAVVPGVSRSGITISMARVLGFGGREAARLSMLLSIPALLLVGFAVGLELYGAGQLSISSDAAIAAVLSFVSALVSIHFMMELLKRMSLLPFVIYRLVLGFTLLVWIYT